MMKTAIANCKDQKGQLVLLSATPQTPGMAAPRKDVAWLGVRPEHLTLCSPSKASLAGRVMVTEYLGAEQYIYVDCGFDDVVTVRIDPALDCAVGDDVGLQLQPDALHYFDAAEDRI